MKKFWSWIKAFFSESRVIRPTGEVSFDINWANYDIDYLDTLLAVSNSGTESGRVGLPAVDQVPPDAVEEQIRLEVTTRVTNTRQQVAQRIAALDVAVSANQINTIRGKIALSEAQRVNDEERHRSALEESHKSQREALGPVREERIALLEFDQEESVKELVGKALRLKEKLPDFQREIREYKEKYGVERNPDIVPQYKRTTGLMVLAVFTLVQATSNAVLLKDLVVQGLLFAIMYAAMIGFVDLFIHWNLGRHGSGLQAYDRLSRFKGYLCSGVFLITLIGWNLATVHLRRIASVYPGEGFDPWWESLGISTAPPFVSSSTFAPLTDYMAIVLIALGIACSAIAFFSGFNWNECIPCFLKNQSRIDEIEEELTDLETDMADNETEHRREVMQLQDDLAKEQQQLRLRQADEMSHTEETFMEEQISQLRDQEEGARDLMRDMQAQLALIKNLEARLSQEEDLANTGFVSLVQRYRIKNREARQQTEEKRPPVYFNGTPSLNLPIREDFVETVEVRVRESEKQYEEIRAMVQRYTADMEEMLPILQQRRMDQFMDESNE